MSVPDSTPAAWAELPRLAKANVLGFIVFMLLLSLLLWPAWRHNPDLSHGFLMPVIFLFLVRESRASGPARFLPQGRGTAVAGILALAGLAVVAVAGVYAAALDWTHALVQFALACGFALLLSAGLFSFSDERVRFVPLNWTAVVAIFLWPLSAPIPPGTYSRITSALQLWVTTEVLDALHLLGIAASRSGNVIQLATTRVGVEEACSGVRSLVSCVFVGLFFSACLVRRPWGRAWIIALAAPLALTMNFFRSLTLTLLANSGVDIRGAWHDATGVAVLALTAMILGGLAIRLGRRSGPTRSPIRRSSRAASEDVPTAATPPSTCSQYFLAAALSLAGVLVLFFYLNTRPSIRRGAPVPDLWALLPASAAGWQVTATGDLSQYEETLQTDHLAQRIYQRGEGAAQTTVILYLAYWRPGQAPVSLVALHTPDTCWPGVGWVPHDLPPVPQPVSIAGRPLDGAESRLFTSAGNPEYAWFWHLYDGRPIAYQNPYSITQLLSIAWHYGFRHGGDQLFVRVSCNRPWPDFTEEPFMKKFFDGVRPLGL